VRGGISLTAEANTVKMFTTTWCGFCKGTKRYLDTKGVAYEEIDIEQFPEYGERIEKETGFRTVPTLEVGGKLYVNPSRKEMDSLFQL
jgi:mycoredoxin